MAEALASSVLSIDLGSDLSNCRPVVAAIDFGTSSSGYAFAFQDEGSDLIKSSSVFLKRWQLGSASSFTDKAPTTVLLKPDKSFDSFGYNAEDKYAQLCETKKENGWWYFQKFKMMLYQTKNLCRDMVIKDTEGKSMPAIEVFSIIITHLKENILYDLRIQNRVITDNDVLYVLTVPAIWSDASKQFMREAATTSMVGIKDDQLKLVLESEAASVYCRQTLSDVTRSPGCSLKLTSLPVGKKYIIADLGGGTLDLATHEIIDGDKLHEIHVARGDDLGGQLFNSRFLEFLAELFGQDTFTAWSKTESADYLALLRLIEGFKWEITKTCKDVLFKVDISLLDLLDESPIKTLENAVSESPLKEYIKVVKNGKLALKNGFLRGFFDSIIHGIIEHISRIRQDVPQVDTVFLVGGLANAAYLRQIIQERFPQYRFLVPEDPVVATLKGAVLLGSRPQTIEGRIARYSYGIDINGRFKEGIHKKEYMYSENGIQRCRHLFKKLIEKGQVLKFNDKFTIQAYASTNFKNHKHCAIRLVQSLSKDPMYCTDEGCKELAKIRLLTPEKEWLTNVECTVQFVVGEAEFKFLVQYLGREYVIKVDFLLT